MRLAPSWHRQGVPLESVRRPILLASTRKSLSMRAWRSREPIASLRYFEKSLQEIRDNPLPEGYWEHLEKNLALCEEYWKTHPQEAPRRAPRGGQAVCSGRSGTPAAGSPEDRENGPGGDGPGGVA